MDPLHPITPGPAPVSRTARLPVQPLERITRERDRPSHEPPERRRRKPPPAPDRQGERDGEDGAGPHIDVRA